MGGQVDGASLKRAVPRHIMSTERERAQNRARISWLRVWSVGFLKLWALNLPRKRCHLQPGPPVKSTHFLHNLITLPSPVPPYASSVPQLEEVSVSHIAR